MTSLDPSQAEDDSGPAAMANGDPFAASGKPSAAEASATAAPSARRRWLRRAAFLAAAILMLPIVLTPIYLVVPPISTLMLWSALTGQGMRRDWVAFEAISPNLVHAVIMSEDGRFCRHRGVDWTQLDRVMARQGGPTRGASTIPMQTVKNLYLWPSRSYIRKGLEIALAYYLDFVWPKRRTIEVYLNIAQWGPGLFGAEAAAQTYFGKSAKMLTSREAALLAAALPNPILRNPAKPSRAMQAHARIVQHRAATAEDYIDCL